MGWAEYSPCIFFTGGKANPWLLAQQWDPWEDKAGKQSPAIGIPPGSHTRFPISDTSTTAVGTSLFCALGLQKRQSKFQRIGKEGKFCSFRAYGQQASKHTKSRDFFVLSAPKQIQDHMDFRRNIPLDFVTDPTLTWHSSQFNTAIYFVTLAPQSLQCTGHLSKSRHR